MKINKEWGRSFPYRANRGDAERTFPEEWEGVFALEPGCESSGKYRLDRSREINKL